MKISKAEKDLELANKKLKEITNQYQALKKSCKTLSTVLKYTTDKDVISSQSRAKKPWELCTKQYKNLECKK